jgi:uncharacterized protein with HEPN domain
VSNPDRRRLQHIVDQIDKISRYTAEGRSAFDEDEKTQDAVIRCLSVIGEAAGALTETTYRMIPALPPQLPKSQRNLLIQVYWRVDLDIVWATIEQNLPALRADIVAVLGERT